MIGETIFIVMYHEYYASSYIEDVFATRSGAEAHVIKQIGDKPIRSAGKDDWDLETYGFEIITKIIQV